MTTDDDLVVVTVQIKMGYTELVREIAAHTGFTLRDAAIVVRALETITAEEGWRTR